MVSQIEAKYINDFLKRKPEQGYRLITKLRAKTSDRRTLQFYDFLLSRFEIV